MSDPTIDHIGNITGHGISLVAIVGAFAGWLPSIAALGAAIWYAVQIWESKTVQDFITCWKEKRHAHQKQHTPEDSPPSV